MDRCWLFNYGCPCRTGSCFGLPDDGCPVYVWFKKLVKKNEEENEQNVMNAYMTAEGTNVPRGKSI